MDRQVKVLEKQVVLDDFINVEAYRLQHSRFDGSLTPELNRLVIRKRDAVAAFVWHRERERVILVEQFRPAVYVNGADGWTVELPAGLMDVDSESPLATMKREMVEEIGYRASELKQLITFYPSIGASSERLTLFYGEVSDADRVSNGGGVDLGEDLRVVEWSLDELAAGIADGRIADSKTIIAVQWYLMQRENG